MGALSSFVEHHKTLMESVGRLRETNEHFRQFWLQVEQQLGMLTPSAGRPSALALLGTSGHHVDLKLDSLLMEPVQRLVRYKLLIRAVLEHTPPDSPDSGEKGLAEVRQGRPPLFGSHS